ncbi:hypothetical protein D3C78_1429570 [compost metagenome]
MAIMPERKTSFFEILAGFVLVAIIITAPAHSINIWMTNTMESGFPLINGRSSEKAPNSATIAMVARKIHIATQLLVGNFLSSNVAVSP